MLDVCVIDSGLEGPHLLVLGAIHGDEVCGPIAIPRVIERFHNKTLLLKKGKVTFVPICNPKAYEKNVRFIDRNLNRYMSPISEPTLYEDNLTNALCPLLESADVLLDIHSYHVGGEPFIFVQDSDSEEVPFAKAIGPKHMVYGFASAYQNTDDRCIEEATKESMGTTEYIRLFDGCGVTLECGQHEDPNSIIVAEQSIYNSLVFLGMIDGALDVINDSEFVGVSKVHYAEEGFEFCDDWVHLQHVTKGTELIRYKDGRVLTAEKDCVLVLPRKTAPHGDECLYLGFVS